MERIVLRLSEKMADALRSYAWSQDREPMRQAERYIREGLIRDGALPDLTKPKEGD